MKGLLISSKRYLSIRDLVSRARRRSSRRVKCHINHTWPFKIFLIRIALNLSIIYPKLMIAASNY